MDDSPMLLDDSPSPGMISTGPRLYSNPIANDSQVETKKAQEK